MRRTSRAFAPRPLLATGKINTSEAKVDVKLDTKTDEQIKLEEMQLKRNTTKSRTQESQPIDLAVSEIQQMSLTTDTNSSGDGDEDTQDEFPGRDLKNVQVIRRGSSFGRKQIIDPIESEVKSEIIPPPRAIPRDRFKSKPFFPTTTVNYNNNNTPVLYERPERKSALGRRHFDADQFLKNRLAVYDSEIENEEVEELVTSISSDNAEDMALGRPFTPVTAQEIQDSPLFPGIVREVQTVALVRKLKRVIFDFKSAQEEQEQEEIRVKQFEEKKEKRAQILQKMLKLDMVETRIFVMQAYDYDRYMSAATASQSTQASTQTNEDREEEGTQTEPLGERNVRWTQMPPRWADSNNALTLEQSIRNRNQGVGEDTRFPNQPTGDGQIGRVKDNRNFNNINFVKEQEKLTNFVKRSSHLIMAILESKVQAQKAQHSAVTLDRKLVVLRDLEMRTVCCDKDMIACTNGHCDYEKYVGGKNVVTVWSLQEPSLPMYFLRVWGQVMVLEMSKMCSLVITGNKDGSLNIWDLKESPQYHSRNREDQIIRTPSICTGGLLQDFRKHTTSIIGVQIIPETHRRARVFSLDRNKILVFWSCSHEKSIDTKSEMGYVASQWATLRIQIRQVVDLSGSFLPAVIDFKFLKMWDHNAFHFLIGTDFGYIGKGIVADEETKVSYEKYYADDTGHELMPIFSVDLNMERNLILGACGDENCRLFEMNLKRAVLSIHCGEVPLKVRWSKRRSSVFYVLLKTKVLIWDLLVSDLTPAKSMEFQEPKDFDILTSRNNEFVVVVCGKSITVETPSLEMKPLTAREESRYKLYLAIIL